MIGYGSLIEEASRRRTIPEAVEASPVEVRDHRRVWGHRMDAVGYVGATTFLTVVPEPGASLNGVLFEIPADRLPDLDIRERGYRRALVDPDQITAALPRSKALDGDTWIYTTDQDHLRLPDPEYPIIQSYIDVCMTGCIDLERRLPAACAGFAREFVTTTRGWSESWANDRLYPRRPQRDVPHAREIDTILRDLVPDCFAAIRIDR
jgi:hypothetical protein